MSPKRDVVVVGAGPAGLTAAINAARKGAKALVLELNAKPGGQLLKQIHKFFGSREHRAGVRGVDIGRQLYREALDLGVEIWLDANVYGISEDGTALFVMRGALEAAATHKTAFHETVCAKSVVLAVGASENSVSFPGWSLPGVMGAGAAQTMINVERVLPGARVVMVGSGNVGLIVSYQLMQAGAEVVAVVEAANRVGGYGVHAAKISRAGVPIRLSTTVSKATGNGQVSVVELVHLNSSWQPEPGSEETLQADVVCIATGLKPFIKLARLVGCRLVHEPVLGGWTPIHNSDMMSSKSGVFVCGDLAGVEEASAAMEEGCLAGLAAAEFAGCCRAEDTATEKDESRQRLQALRIGPFGQARGEAILRLTKAGDKACQTRE